MRERSESCKPRRQCAHCPWKVSTDPHEIPNGYSVEKHRALENTIARGLDFDIGRPLRIMSCHETHELPCVGWLSNQLGPGNNIALRMQAMRGDFGRFELDGEQHERFEDTLPSGVNAASERE